MKVYIYIFVQVLPPLRNSILDIRYDYANRNPFYQDTQSEIAETPGLELETPMNYRPILHSPRRSVINPSTLSQKIAEEKRRLDKLQNSVNRIKRQVKYINNFKKKMYHTNTVFFILVFIFG